MENKKLKRRCAKLRRNVDRKLRQSQGIHTLHRRKGVALVLALAVTLIGSVLAAMIYEMTFNYFWFRQPQKELYVNHTTVLDAIQAMKGYIIQTNSEDQKAMHVPDLDFESTDITSVNLLRFSDPELKVDTSVKSGVGAQRLTLEVYDLYYNPAKLNSSLWSDPVQMKELPPPFNLTASYELEDMIDDDGKGHNSDVDNLLDDNVILNPQKYGAYLIRAKLYSGSKLVRTAEEVFIQVFE
jgi:hypothetical protein